MPSSGSTDFALTVSNAATNVPAFLLLGVSDSVWQHVPLPLDLSLVGAPGCFLNVSMDDGMLTSTDASGRAVIELPLPHPAPLGLRFFAQWAVFDQASSFGWSFSEGLATTIQR